MAKQRQPDEEEVRLLAIAEACHSEEIAASDLLTNPVQSLVYSEYNRLIEELRAKRLKGHQPSPNRAESLPLQMDLERHKVNFKQAPKCAAGNDILCDNARSREKAMY